VGIRLKEGTTVHINEIQGTTKISINERSEDARITRHVLESMAPGRSFEVNIECGLPPGQGFGMSASGAIAVALCVSEIIGKSRMEAFEAAHSSEVICGGGLGDVAGLMHEFSVPVRIKAGMPPFGSVIDGKISFEKMTLIVLEDRLSTAEILGDESRVKKICNAGDVAMGTFEKNGGKEQLFGISRRFSYEAGVMGSKVADTMKELDEIGSRSLMCMLGNSIFTDLSENDAREILGEEKVYATASTSEPAKIIRKA
jgi:pantoate kinase